MDSIFERNMSGETGPKPSHVWQGRRDVNYDFVSLEKLLGPTWTYASSGTFMLALTVALLTSGQTSRKADDNSEHYAEGEPGKTQSLLLKEFANSIKPTEAVLL